MDFQDLKKNWNEFGQQDPLWAILADPTKKNNRWNLDEFFQSGRDEINEVVAYVQGLGVLQQQGSALDFGCGVGRLSQALCPHFAQVKGVDIAASMVEQARQYNQFGDRCEYFLNEKSDLSQFSDSSCDFIYSNIVLQHMRPDYSQGYLREFLRLLSPGGLLVFQLPSELASQQPEAGKTRSPIAQTLPKEGFKAQIQLPKLPKLEANVPVALAVQVTNASSQTWPSLGTADGTAQIKLGNHWLDAQGNRVVTGQSRATLIQDLAPGETTTLTLIIAPPAQPGQYTLELDMVQELITWFQDQGSATLKIPVTLEKETAIAKWQKRLTAPNLVQRLWNKLRPAAAAEEEEPHMEMYGTPKEIILAMLQAQGGEVLDVVQNDAAGPEWISYRYCVRKLARL